MGKFPSSIRDQPVYDLCYIDANTAILYMSKAVFFFTDRRKITKSDTKEWEKSLVAAFSWSWIQEPVFR